jgi:hypothetical protein
MTEQPKPQNWHQIVGEGWEKFLSPVKISVFTELKVMSQPPRVDILLFRRDEPTWTAEQMARLPDGIRQSTASHILIELKYTESINQKAFSQAITYDYLYKESQELTDKEVQTFVLSAIKPQASTRKKWGYHRAKLKGVYYSQDRFLQKIPLISINELSNQPHNAFIKCFATHKNEREKAYQIFEQESSLLGTEAVELYLIGLWQWFEEGEKMNIELTPENVMALGQKFGKTYLSTLSPETRKRFFSSVPIEERLAGVNPTDVMNYFKPEQLVAGLKPKERLAGLSRSEIEELEEQIKKLKQQKNG